MCRTNDGRYGRPLHATRHRSLVDELFEQIPDDAVVAANYRLTPHLAHRAEIYQFPVPFRILLYGPDASREGERLDDRSGRQHRRGRLGDGRQQHRALRGAQDAFVGPFWQHDVLAADFGSLDKLVLEAKQCHPRRMAHLDALRELR